MLQTYLLPARCHALNLLKALSLPSMKHLSRSHSPMRATKSQESLGRPKVKINLFVFRVAINL